MKIVNILFLNFFILFSLYAEDANQFLGGQLKDSPIDNMEIKKESSFLPGTAPEVDYKGKKDQKSALLPFQNHEHNHSEPQAGDFGITTPFQKRSNLIVNKNKDIFTNTYKKGKTALSFTYIKDDFDVTDSRGIFKRTYDNNSGSKRAGTVLIGFDKYFYRKGVDFAYGMNLGFGLSQGKGTFISSNTLSDTKFSLWTIPADLSLTMGKNLGKSFRLALSGGPSLMGLYQTRDDKKSGERYKYRRQIGFGYFGIGKLSLSLGNIFSDSQFSLFRDFKISNYFLNFIVRVQNYDNFQDEITISGSSFGLGLTFDYL